MNVEPLGCKVLLLLCRGTWTKNDKGTTMTVEVVGSLGSSFGTSVEA